MNGSQGSILSTTSIIVLPRGILPAETQEVAATFLQCKNCREVVSWSHNYFPSGNAEMIFPPCLTTLHWKVAAVRYQSGV